MTFGERLNKAMEDGNLTVADLSRWFDRPYATVRGWLGKFEPGGTNSDIALVVARLTKLEGLIRRKDGFPVRPGFSWPARIVYLEKIRRKK